MAGCVCLWGLDFFFGRSTRSLLTSRFGFACAPTLMGKHIVSSRAISPAAHILYALFVIIYLPHCRC